MKLIPDVADQWSQTMFTAKSHTIGHFGPAQAYLAKAPNDDLATFSGLDADWLKIGYFGPKNDSAWSTYMQNGVSSLHMHLQQVNHCVGQLHLAR